MSKKKCFYNLFFMDGKNILFTYREKYSVLRGHCSIKKLFCSFTFSPMFIEEWWEQRKNLLIV